jgi:hypothetical protein
MSSRSLSEKPPPCQVWSGPDPIRLGVYVDPDDEPNPPAREIAVQTYRVRELATGRTLVTWANSSGRGEATP